MFQNPSESAGIDIDPGKYYVKVAKLEPVSGQFGDQVKWTFELATLDGQVILTDRGFNAEFWQWSSPKITRGGKKPSKAYSWGEALLPGVEIMDLTGEEFASMVVGKKAVALIGPNDSGRTAILSLSPVPAKGGKTAAKTAPPPEPPDDADLIEADAIEAEQREAVAAPW